MKKTLITLLAMATSAMGADWSLSDAVLTVDTPANSVSLTSTGITDGTFTVAAQLNADFFDEVSIGQPLLSKSSFFSVTDATNTNWHIGAAVGTSTSAGKIVKSGLYTTSKAADTFAADTSGWLSIGQDGCLTSSVTRGVDSAALTMTYDASTFTVSLYLTLAYLDREAVTITGSNTSFQWSGNTLSTLGSLEMNTDSIEKIYVFAGAATAEQAAAMNAALVPEPATATLSLLALAGLAARRRR